MQGQFDEVSPPRAVRELHGKPGPASSNKVIDHIDDHLQARFIAACPFVMVATRGADAALDLSPKGDPAVSSRSWTKRHSRSRTALATTAWTP